MKRFTAALLGLLLLCCCAKPAHDTEGVRFTDDLGREVTAPFSPERTAALLGSFAEVWQLSGGEVCAAVDDAWDDLGLTLSEDTVNLGGTKQPSLELLFASRPELVLASANTRIDLEWMDALEQAGIPTAYFDVNSFEDYLRMLKICTDITGRDDLYRKNGLNVKAQVDDAVAKSAGRIKSAGEAPSVLLLRLSASALLAKGSDSSVAGEMLRDLGCRNIADGDSTLIESLSLEHILLSDPDYIFLLPFGDDTEGMRRTMEETLLSHPAWAQLSAVRDGRVHLLPKRLYSLKPNALWGEAYQNMERILSDGPSAD